MILHFLYCAPADKNVVLLRSITDDNSIDYLIKVVPPPRFPIIKLLFLFTPRRYLFYKEATWNYSPLLCKLSKKKFICFHELVFFFFHCIKWAIIHDCDYLMVSSNYLQFNQWEAVQVECSHPAGVRRGCLSSSFLVAQDVPDSSFSRLFAANPCTKRRYDRNPNLAFPYCHIHFSGPSNGCG